MLFAKTAKTLLTRRCFSHDAGRVLTQLHPGGMKPLTKPDPSVGLQDHATKLWSMNPGLVVFLSGVAAFGAGCVIHLMTVPMPLNSSIEKALEDEKTAWEPSSFPRHNTLNRKKNA
mmetsp:Transcript_27719/g.47158  ORF Transcript_27719/g.47158 Transcript_27719/m.47158 type:complete len:116 (+) Transcript_27719:116-463(+)